MKTDMRTLVWGDLMFSAMHGRLVRFVRYEGAWAAVMDRNTLAELPDYVLLFPG